MTLAFCTLGPCFLPAVPDAPLCFRTDSCTVPGGAVFHRLRTPLSPVKTSKCAVGLTPALHGGAAWKTKSRKSMFAEPCVRTNLGLKWQRLLGQDSRTPGESWVLKAWGNMHCANNSKQIGSELPFQGGACMRACLHVQACVPVHLGLEASAGYVPHSLTTFFSFFKFESGSHSVVLTGTTEL